MLICRSIFINDTTQNTFMDRITLRGRIMIHLFGFRYVDKSTSYGAPFEITQDGIGMALGITRSYASLMLSRMEKSGEIEHGMSTILHSPNVNKRRIYFLTAKGMKTVESLNRTLEEDGGNLSELKLREDIDHCDSETIECMDIEDRDIIGCMCILRSKVSRKDLPREVPLMRFDRNGDLSMKDSTKERIVSMADEMTVRRWHSMAADWWIDHGNNLRERLYHLTYAGRTHEARRLFVSRRYELMESPNNEMTDIGVRLASDSTDPVLIETVARMLMSCDRHGDLDHLISRLPDDYPPKDALNAESALVSNRSEDALTIALNGYCGDVTTSIALGKCMLANGRPKEAEVFLARARRSMVDEKCTFRLDEVLVLEAECAIDNLDLDKAESKLRAAGRVTRNRRMGERMELLMEHIIRSRDRSENGVGFEVVEIGDVKVPDVLDVPFEHREPLESESPCEHGTFHTEGFDDLGPEYARSSELHPLSVEKDLQLQ